MLELHAGPLDLSRAKVAILWHWWLLTRFEVRREGDVKEVKAEFLIRCKLKCTGDLWKSWKHTRAIRDW